MKFYEREPFDDQKVEAIRTQLQNLSDGGNAADYQVILDDMDVVPRTNNVQQFTSFYDLLGHNCKNLVINVFSGATRHKRTYSFYFRDGIESSALNGAPPDPQKIIDEKVAKIAAEMENKQLKEQVKDLREMVLDIEKENDELRSDNQTLREDMRKTLGENGIVGTIVGSVERIMDKYNPANNSPLSGATNNSSQPKNAPGMVSIPLKEYDDFKTFDAMASKFSDEEIDKLFNIIKFMCENKPAIDEVLDFITEEKPHKDDTQENHD